MVARRHRERRREGTLARFEQDAAGSWHDLGMEYRILVHRVLGVPDIVQTQNRSEAAARKLLQRGAMPLDAEHISMARTVISISLMMCDDGLVDPLWGGWQTVPETAAMLVERLPANVPAPAMAKPLAENLFEQLREYVARNPHGEEPGRPIDLR